MPLASTVRLHPSDDLFDKGTFSLEEPSSSFVAGKLIHTPTYWEVGFTQHIFRGISVGLEHQCGGQTVQGASQIVDNVPDDGAKIGRNIFDNTNAIDFDAGFRLFIGEEIICVTLSERVH